MFHHKEPLVSIAIPTHNRADGYLKQAIASAAGQTYPNIEIIVSDNCSADNTKDVVTAFGDPRIRYIRQEKNIGANNNFNFCLAQARGEFFLLLQDDDLIDRDFISTCMGAAGCALGIGIVRSGTRIIDENGVVLREIPNMVGGLPTEEFFLGWFSGKTALYLCSTLFNTGLLREMGGFRSRHNLFQDVIAELYLASRFGRADVEAVKASFRKHACELTFAAKVNDWCEDSLDVLDLLCELVPVMGRQEIRKEGMRFFSRTNFGRAAAVKAPLGRLAAYFYVWRKFNFRHLPPLSHFISPVCNLFYGTPAHGGVRFIKRMLRNE